MTSYSVLLIGSGGREHALASVIAASPLCQRLWIAPGNGGTGEFGTNVSLDVADFDALGRFVTGNQINMIVVGPEAPLVDGITDYFQQDAFRHVFVVGPDARSAQLEGSKAFAKKFMQTYHIPTAGYLEVNSDNLQEGLQFLRSLKPPYVLKADGLAAGKGVLILPDLKEAENELAAMLEGKFGSASRTVVIEEFLDGIEFSVFALTDGKNYVLLPQAKDYKRVGEGDTGLNTGGMGAVSPVPFVDKILLDKVINNIVEPTIRGLHEEKMNYNGFVFFGLIRVGNDPYVIEYNCRMGDPETEVVLPRLDEDLLALFGQMAEGKLETKRAREKNNTAATIMLVSGGYPGTFEKNKKISFPASLSDGVTIFHAGTKEENGDILTSGGRVLAVTGFASTMEEALQKAISAADTIHFDGKYFRRDIGFDL